MPSSGPTTKVTCEVVFFAIISRRASLSLQSGRRAVALLLSCSMGRMHLRLLPTPRMLQGNSLRSIFSFFFVVRVVLVGVQVVQVHDEEQDEAHDHDDVEDDQREHGDMLHADDADAVAIDVPLCSASGVHEQQQGTLRQQCCYSKIEYDFTALHLSMLCGGRGDFLPRVLFFLRCVIQH
ncbi:uncharacterized protein CC84DRAFT_489832 [Paraphaeosphaeria sporulosa]|uniref:Uncharacterized protein n=1 Tax=Paraphaeosphaeria sporulosa TaxID=1460663 RepID=A0A177CTG7_9PLEO|nr:uncharacterized protein CC84DRAFT_489832 [Paraphaeosphaeria sporulosa]OAG10576.1 hypothetical protein CC84DRAFT_489832 [Paraphaeosphaeria sporulosa]